jgi:hypothetical protein
MRRFALVRRRNNVYIALCEGEKMADPTCPDLVCDDVSDLRCKLTDLKTAQQNVCAAKDKLVADLTAWDGCPPACQAVLKKHAAKGTKVGAFDPTAILQLLEDLATAVPSLAPVLADLVTILGTL